MEAREAAQRRGAHPGGAADQRDPAGSVAPQLRRAGDGGARGVTRTARRVGAPVGGGGCLGQATRGATFGWEHLPGAEQEGGLRGQLAREGERSAAYREGRSWPVSAGAALA